MNEQIPLHEIVKDLSGHKDLWCDKRLFSLINRALNLCSHRAHVKIINQEAVLFSVVPLLTDKDHGEINGEKDRS